MKNYAAFLIAGACAFSLTACETTKQSSGDASTQTSAETVTQPTDTGLMEKNGISLMPYSDSPLMPEAAMRLNSPAGSAAPGPVAFSYEVTNFALTKMTGTHHMEEMANSMQGQHIHNIVDNEPYTAHYETNFTKDMKEGNHVILSFLSRSYHESLKHAAAYDLRTLTVGKPKTANDFDVKGQHMFYSRPKGDYKGDKETKKVMLDFYLVNTTLSPEGNKVRATINGTEFMLDKWLPYQMEGLPMGENTIKLELVDSTGAVIPGKFNTVERKFTLKAS